MRRFGIFLIWLGGILILLFIISFQTQSSNFGYLLYGLIGLVFGTILSTKNKNNANPKKNQFPHNKHPNDIIDSADENEEIRDQKSLSQNIKTTRRKHY